MLCIGLEKIVKKNCHEKYVEGLTRPNSYPGYRICLFGVEDIGNYNIRVEGIYLGQREVFMRGSRKHVCCVSG